MKLDLLYEFQPKPVAQAAPVRPARGRAAAYDEAIEQIQLADTLGFHTVVVRRAPLPRRPLALPDVGGGPRRAVARCTENIRLGFGVTLMPPGFTPPGARGREGRHRRHPLATAGSSGAPVARRRWSRSRSASDRRRAASSGGRRSRSSCGMWEDETSRGTARTSTSPPHATPKPYQDPHPPCWLAATSDGSAAVAGKLGLGLLSFALLQPVETMAQQIEQYRDAAAIAPSRSPG